MSHTPRPPLAVYPGPRLIAPMTPPYYKVQQLATEFVIRKEQVPDALAAVKWMMTRPDGRPCHYDMVNNQAVLNASTFEDTMAAWGWTISYDEDGHVDFIDFAGDEQKVNGGDNRLFAILAPYVEDGSYITMKNCFGCCWKWLFQEGDCLKIADDGEPMLNMCIC